MARTAYKRLTPTNALDPDKASALFLPSLDGWIERVMAVELAEAVPEEVSTLFETARGAMVYGYFFYPLLSLGGETLHRTLECAVSHKCSALGGPSKSYAKQLEWLRDRGVLTAERHEKWRSLRDLRNLAAHPKFHPLYPPGMVEMLLGGITDEINALFDPGHERQTGPRF